jgi:hypothetical protein
MDFDTTVDIWTLFIGLFFIWNKVFETGLYLSPQVNSLLSYAQYRHLVPISGYQNHHKEGYVNEHNINIPIVFYNWLSFLMA